jgi:hypothetical protein
MARHSISDAELAAQIVRARAAAKEADEKEPRVADVRFDSSSRKFVLDLKNGTTFIFPADLVQGLTGAPEALLAKVGITPSHEGLMWEELDVYVGVPALMMGIFGTKAWMAELGRAGGLKTSDAKARAARENGKKGGRPKRTGNA